MSATTCGMISSASPSTKCWILGKPSWPVVNSGPPAMTVLPSASQRSDDLVHRLPVHNHRAEHHVIRPAQILVAQAGRTFRSTSRSSQSRGSIAATVSKPSGGKAAFLETNRSTCLKLQNVSGVCG